MNIERSNSNQAIVRTTIELGHSLGLKVVAEGIETPEVWATLLRLGCDLAQGYFISRPMPADAGARLGARSARAAGARSLERGAGRHHLEPARPRRLIRPRPRVRSIRARTTGGQRAVARRANLVPRPARSPRIHA